MATELYAPMVGKIVEFLVNPGDEVEEDDEVAILESMKMEIPIESTDDGTVKEIRVSEGDAVKDGQVLVVLG